MNKREREMTKLPHEMFGRKYVLTAALRFVMALNCNPCSTMLVPTVAIIL